MAHFVHFVMYAIKIALIGVKYALIFFLVLF